jgi:hypothetical protein
VDDIASIESELAENANRLRAQGVSIAEPTPTDAAAVGGDGAGDDSLDYAEEEDAPTEAAEEAPRTPPPAADAARERNISRKDRAAKRAEQDRCERICDLATATCDLAARICGLANEHVDEVRYEEACDRAEAQCEAASEACDNC